MVMLEQEAPSALFALAKGDRAYDTELWTHLLPLCRDSSSACFELQDQIFAEALRQYPTSLFVWTQRIALALARLGKPEETPLSGASDVLLESLSVQTASIFLAAAQATLSPQVWDHYLTWLQRPGAEELPSSVEALYEQAVSQVGFDVHAVNLWMGYIRFVKEKKTENQFEEQLQLDALRKLYQRAVVIPMIGVEGIWREYDLFENGLNKVTGRKILAERSGAYMNARALSRELRALHEDGKITRGIIVGYGLPHARDREQLGALLAWIDWEMKNHLSLAADSLYERICWAFRSALAHAYSSEQLWFHYFEYLVGSGTIGAREAAISDLHDHALPYLSLSVPLHALLLEAYETSEDVKVGTALLESLLCRFSLAIAEVERREAPIKDGMSASKGTDTQPFTVDEGPGLLVAPSISLAGLKRDHCMTLKHAIRFARRTQGLPLARQYFARARKLPYCTHEIFTLAANMEFFVGKDPGIAFKIFELGMKLFSEEPTFVISYMKLLLIKLDESNIKSLFERALRSLASNKSAIKELWLMLIRHERDYGHLVRVKELCNRLIAEEAPESNRFHFSLDGGWTLFLDRNELADSLHDAVGMKDTTNTKNAPWTPAPYRGGFASDAMPLSQPAQTAAMQAIRKRPRDGVAAIPSGEDILKSVLNSCGPVSAYNGPVVPAEAALELFRSIKA